MLPDVLTEADLFPAIDASLLLTQFGSIEDIIERPRGRSEDITLPEYSESFLLPSPEKGRRATREEEEEPELYDDEIPLDIGEDLHETTMMTDAPSIELGRGLNTPSGIRDSILSDPILPSDAFNLPEFDDGTLPPLNDDETILLDKDDAVNGEEPLQDDQQQRTPKPTSSKPAGTDPDASFGANLDTTDLLPEDETEPPLPQRTRRTKRAIELDNETVIQSAEFRSRQTDRSRILKPSSFLPSDPTLMNLLNLSQTGGFVSSIFNPMGYNSGLVAPELQGMISLDAVRAAGESKRKRDSGIAMNDEEELDRESPRSNKQLRLSPDEDRVEVDDEMRPPMMDEDEMPMLAGQEDDLAALNLQDLDEEERPSEHDVGNPSFDETTIPLIHPADNGPISLGTKHAVHFLRDQFSDTLGTQTSPSKRTPKKSQAQAQSIMFGDMFPAGSTTRADATKMFFEVLVLATKDAVKVEQLSGGDQRGSLGGDIRIRAKRGLWGGWAELQQEPGMEQLHTPQVIVA